ncbi:MAG TPA: arginine repressor [Gemmatimonadales bacterium]|jgi:transcriptional regulator of arginine metabolism|nr:arginine repressor [Gemmatimonadales bacterium]
MKPRRQALILKLIAETRIENQDALKAALAREGVEATQATLSRDLRELGLVKLADPSGGSFYARAGDQAVAAPRPQLARLVQGLLLEVDGVGPFVVLRTAPGGAGALSAALDQAAWEEVVGTIAGDDTILVITRSEKARRVVGERMKVLAG